MADNKKGFDLASVLGSVSKLDTGADEGREQIEYIDISLLDGDARNFYELTDIDQLAANIELFGLQQPLRVRANPDAEGRYIIVSGHRRRAALQMLVEAGNEKWAKVACIKEQGKDSEALQELRLIYANSDTRRLSSADISKQVERVEALLYQLKEEGYDFPGRMRDHVAEACKISKTKLARLKVIRDNLDKCWVKPYEKGDLNESCAYTLARLPKDMQQVLRQWARDADRNIKWLSERELDTKSKRLKEISKLKCPGDGGDCINKENKKQKSLSIDTYSMHRCSACCSTCSDLARCKFACPNLAEQVKKLRADASAQRKQENLAKEERERPIISKIMDIWNRFGQARSAAGKSLDEYCNAEGISKWALGNECDVMAKECLEGKFNTGTKLPYGYSCYLSDAEYFVKAADLFGVSLDYLLCRTDIPQMATQAAPQPAGQLVFSGWMPGGTTPADPCDVVAVFDVGGPEPAKMLVYWTGREFTFKKNGAKIDMTPVKWMALPPDEDVEA